MIDLNAAWVKAALEGISTRVALAAEALDWADGRQTLDATELAPSMTPGDTTWTRLSKHVQSLGPRIVKHKLTAAVGSVTWGGDNPNDIDERLDDLDLEGLAAVSLKHLCALGIAGLTAYQPDGGRPRIQRLGGYLEPIYDEGDLGGEPIAWFQVLSEADGRSYRLRMYDPDPEDETTGTIREWREAPQPYQIGVPPTAEFESQPMPRVVMLDRDQAGLPIGELTTALPLLKAEVAQQLRQARAADANAWPVKWMKGGWDIPAEGVGADSVLVSEETDADMGRLEPPDLAPLFTMHDRQLERLRGDLQLPISSITTGSFPSGEALDQANAASVANARMYARLLTRLLTGAVEDYAVLLGIPRAKAPPVSVEINREQTRRLISENARLDHSAGLIPFRAAALAVAQYYPHLGDKELEDWIAGQERRVSVSDFNALVGSEE